MLQKLGRPNQNGGVEQGEMDGQVRVGVDDVHKYRTWGNRDSQFLPALPDEGLLQALAWLCFSAHELP